MNYIYLVKRTDEVGYDEYDSCVLIATSDENVLEMINRKKDEKIYYWDNGKRTIELIGQTEKPCGEVLNSFCAG